MLFESLSSAAETELALVSSPDPAFNGAMVLVRLDSALPPLAFSPFIHTCPKVELLTTCVHALWHEHGCDFDTGKVGLCNTAICLSDTAAVMGFKIYFTSYQIVASMAPIRLRLACRGVSTCCQQWLQCDMQTATASAQAIESTLLAQ